MDQPHGTPFLEPPDLWLPAPPAVVGKGWGPYLPPLSWEPGMTVIQKVPNLGLL